MPTSLKRMLKEAPVLGPTLQKVAGLLHSRPVFHSSAQYWEDRYRAGGNSGAGSYNRLAQFKAETLNDFVRTHRVGSVIEFGCGDGAQLKLARYPHYVGIDVSPTAVERCRKLYHDDASKAFFTTADGDVPAKADLALSLDVIYHLVEDSVFNEYMRRLFESADRFVIVYSSDKDQDWPAKHVRHRKFTEWVRQNRPDWRLAQVISNRYPYDPSDEAETSFADFYIFSRGAMA